MRFNGVVLRLIEGPGHRLLPRELTEISYIGPISGSAIRLPAQSVIDGNRFLVVAVHPDRKRWWRAFRLPRPARLVRGGSRYESTGHLLDGSERLSTLQAYLVAHPATRRVTGPSTPVIAFEKVDPGGSTTALARHIWPQSPEPRSLTDWSQTRPRAKG